MSAINTPYATLSFANLFTPRPRGEDGKPVYNCVLIFDPQQQKSPAYKALKDACIAAARHALELRPNLPQAHMKLAQALLAKGEMGQGWDEYAPF